MVQCDLHCGGFHDKRSECSSNPCLAQPGACGHNDCLDWCCETSTPSVVGAVVGALVLSCCFFWLIRACIRRRRYQHVVVVEQVPYQQLTAGQPVQYQQGPAVVGQPLNYVPYQQQSPVQYVQPYPAPKQV